MKFLCSESLSKDLTLILQVRCTSKAEKAQVISTIKLTTEKKPNDLEKTCSVPHFLALVICIFPLNRLFPNSILLTNLICIYGRQVVFGNRPNNLISLRVTT